VAHRWWVQCEDCCAQILFRSPSAHHPHRHSSRQHRRGERLARGVRVEASPSQALVSRTCGAKVSALEELQLVPARWAGGEQPLMDGSHR
jgi:hypothetical protein